MFFLNLSNPKRSGPTAGPRAQLCGERFGAPADCILAPHHQQWLHALWDPAAGPPRIGPLPSEHTRSAYKVSNSTLIPTTNSSIPGILHKRLKFFIQFREMNDDETLTHKIVHRGHKSQIEL